MIVTGILAAAVYILAVALVVGALVWRAELRERLADQRADHERDIAEWRDEVARLNNWAQDLHDRWLAAESRAGGYLAELDALTVGRPSRADVAEAALAGGDVIPDGGWQLAQDVLADIRALPETEGPQ